MKNDCTQSNGMRNWIRKRIGRRVCRSLVFEFCRPLSEGGTRTGAGQGWRHIGKAVLGRRPVILKASLGPNRTKQRPNEARVQRPATAHWLLRKIGWLLQLPRLRCPTEQHEEEGRRSDVRRLFRAEKFSRLHCCRHWVRSIIRV
jgi:hypothetical protein